MYVKYINRLKFIAIIKEKKLSELNNSTQYV